VRLAEAHHPDVILMDLRMPGTDGIAATAQLLERLPAVRVLVLTTYADQDAIVPALQAGARGYLTKDASAEEIEAAIRAVHAGQTHLAPAIQERLVATVISQPSPAPPAGPGQNPPGGLTAREAEVLTLLAAGLSNAEIAQRLYLSHATVKTHINRIFAKTGARDRAQAVRYAYSRPGGPRAINARGGAACYGWPGDHWAIPAVSVKPWVLWLAPAGSRALAAVHFSPASVTSCPDRCCSWPDRRPRPRRWRPRGGRGC
jgi:DNA-binding NarL/FixJ family response regulator